MAIEITFQDRRSFLYRPGRFLSLDQGVLASIAVFLRPFVHPFWSWALAWSKEGRSGQKIIFHFTGNGKILKGSGNVSPP